MSSALCRHHHKHGTMYVCMDSGCRLPYIGSKLIWFFIRDIFRIQDAEDQTGCYCVITKKEVITFNFMENILANNYGIQNVQKKSQKCRALLSVLSLENHCPEEEWQRFIRN